MLAKQKVSPINSKGDGESMDERRRQSMIAYLRHRMEEFGIRAEDLAAALDEDARKVAEARYRNSNGDTWDGKGDMPQWLRQAVSAGQSLEHFAVTKQPENPTTTKARIDWSQDPFAGSRLARVSA